MADYKVVDIEQLEAGLTATAEAIREHTGKEDLMKLEEMPEEIEGVFEAGKKSEYDAFWDEFQDYGNRTHYLNAFDGKGFNKNNFYPKYNIVFGENESNWTFIRWNDDDKHTLNLKERMELCGVSFDFTQLKTSIQTFYYTKFTEIPALDMSNVTSFDRTFAYNYGLKSIEELTIGKDASFNDAFAHSNVLEKLIIKGCIGGNGFNTQWCTKLSKDSIISIINALSTSTSGLTVTLSQTAVNRAFATATGAENGSTSEEWLALAATKSNWTISLA